MKRIVYATALLPLLIFGSGCAMCENRFDDDSPAQGGICGDAGCGGRAGSIITPGYGEMIVDEKIVENGESAGAEPQPTEAAPPLPEDIPLPPAKPVESADDEPSLPGFDELTPPDELGAPDLAPPEDTLVPPTDSESRAPLPLLPDIAPRPAYSANRR